MIRSLKLRNFRAFRNQAFDFSRINIFVGPNSSGKSSAISALNFLAQSLRQVASGSGSISLNGAFEHLGTFIDVVHGNRVNTPINFDLTYGDDKTTHDVRFDLKYRPQRRELEVSTFEYLHDGKSIYKYSTSRDSYSVSYQGTPADAIEGASKHRPRFVSFFPIDSLLSRYSFYSLEETERQLLTDKTREFLRDTDRQLRRGRSALLSTFNLYDALSPFRDPPQRTYHFTGEAPDIIGRLGSNAISMIVNDSSRRESVRAGYLERISEWLRVTGIAKGISLRPISQRHFEICLEDFDGRSHNICDVGFGCSQVLPVIVGCMNAFLGPRQFDVRNRIFSVQEPEIHLHPNAQAALGSFFVSLLQQRGQIFIETHSDHLILRVLRHVARGELNAKDVRIFICENRNGEKHVSPLSVDERGVFNPSWPGGFFPQRETEALGLARARQGSHAVAKDDQLSFSYPEETK